MDEKRLPYSVVITSLASVVAALVFLLLPLVFFTGVTEYFILPKQVLIVASSFILVLLYCARVLVERKVIFVKNPLNLPVFLFAVFVALSSYFSPSSLNSLPLGMTVVCSCILYFAVVNLVITKQSFQLALVSLIVGSAIAGVINILSVFGVFLIPVEEAKNEFFSTMGSQVQMIGYLTPLIIFTASNVLNKYRKKGSESFKKLLNAFYGISFVIFTITIAIVFYQIATSEAKPILLPFEHGFQLALAAISQNEARLLPSFLLGSGYGTFTDVFTRFHLPSFNMLTNWNLTFAYSSSFVLEIIATTGMLGFLSFVFIIVKLIRSNRSLVVRPLFLSAVSLVILSFIIPFSFPLIALLLILLSLYIVSLRLSTNVKSVEEVNLSLVSGKTIFEVNDGDSRKSSLVLPVVLTVISVGFMMYVLFFLVGRGEGARKGLYNLMQSDMLFAKSLKPDALNNGQQTYDLQIDAIESYPYRSDYYRIFSQINLALASNLANSQQEAPTPNEEVQNAILQQLQVAINASRQAVDLNRESSVNWRNLGQVYRNLIGVGEGAEQYAITSYNAAISLDPNNPTLRIELGGIFYQLKEYDLAQNQFQIAASLKPNFANAYYNLGHTLEQKGQLAQALQQYQIVRQLVANDPASVEMIDKEIKAIQDRIGTEGETVTPPSENVEPSDDTNLELQDGTTQFPEREPREQIPPPPSGEEEELSPTPTPEPQS